MLRLSKQLIPVLLIAFIILAGCSAKVDTNADVNTNTNDNHIEDTSDAHYLEPVEHSYAGKEINSPVVISFVVDNPLEIKYIDESENQSHQRSYFQISGLIDQVVEEQINKAIKSLYHEMLPYVTGEKLIPYRGIKTVVNSGGRIEYSNLMVIPHLNSNNILSVGAHVSGSYYKPSNIHTYFSLTESLNFDLATGKTFLLPDVFTNDVNGLETINDAIISELARRALYADLEYDSYQANLSLVAPFKGVNHRQKFFLSHEGVNVIIDYNNPEFAIGFSDTAVTIPYYSNDGHIAITQRFYDENKPIFTREPVSKRLLQDFQLNISRVRDSYQKNGTEWHVSIAHPENLPQSLKDIVNNLRDDLEKEIALKAQESPISSVEQHIYAHRIGKYINISSGFHYFHSNESHWQENNFVYTETGEPIMLDDIFMAGYDYASLLKKAMDKAIKDYGFAQGSYPETLINEIMFRLNDTSISFTTKPYEWSSGGKHPLHFIIPYEEIGYKNLKIF